MLIETEFAERMIQPCRVVLREIHSTRGRVSTLGGITEVSYKICANSASDSHSRNLSLE